MYSRCFRWFPGPLAPSVTLWVASLNSKILPPFEVYQDLVNQNIWPSPILYILWAKETNLDHFQNAKPYAYPLWASVLALWQLKELQVSGTQDGLWKSYTLAWLVGGKALF